MRALPGRSGQSLPTLFVHLLRRARGRERSRPCALLLLDTRAVDRGIISVLLSCQMHTYARTFAHAKSSGSEPGGPSLGGDSCRQHLTGVGSRCLQSVDRSRMGKESATLPTIAVMAAYASVSSHFADFMRGELRRCLSLGELMKRSHTLSALGRVRARFCADAWCT